MSPIFTYEGTGERLILKLLLDGHITTSEAQTYLSNFDTWRQGYSSYPANQWVGVSAGQTVIGFTYRDVRDGILGADPNAKPFIGYVTTIATP